VQAGNQNYLFQSGRVTADDPPLEVPGSAVVTLDQHRALVEYRALPSETSRATDWRPLLAATGIDMSTLTPAAPRATPPVASDARAAWSASFAGRSDRVTIETASLKGRPAWLRVEGPWHRDDRAAPVVLPFAIGSMQLVIMLGSTLTAVIVTRRSLRRGRADRTGALRLALYLGGCLFAAWIIAAHHAADPESEARMLSMGIGEAAATALIVWVFYIALEPGVRRTWPRAMIGWARLLAGRFRDAMVGREILLGIAAGAIGSQLFWLGTAVKQRLSHSPAPLFVHAPVIDPLAIFAGDHLVGHVASMEIAVGTAFLLLMFRKMFGATGGMIVFALLASSYVFYAPGISTRCFSRLC